MSELLDRLNSLADQGRYLESLDVVSLDFAGFERDVYVAHTPEQRHRGLSGIEYPEADGMLIYSDSATYAPIQADDLVFEPTVFSYNESHALLESFEGGGTKYVSSPYNYAVIAPSGTIPTTGWDFSG